MSVGCVSVFMSYLFMLMRMTMLRYGRIVDVVMVSIGMIVSMFMLGSFMNMQMFVLFNCGKIRTKNHNN